jgi:hypothetical protein
MAARARVVPAGLNGVNPATVLAELPIVDGAVTLDSTASIRGVLDLTTTADWFPDTDADPVTPYGNELFIERGVVYGDGSREWVSQGYYRIDSVEQQTAPNGSVEITGSDRSAGIADARIPFPLTFTAGTTVADVIETLIVDVYLWAVFDLDPSLSTTVLASDQITTDDRAGFLANLVAAYGMVGFWDYRGVYSVHPAPSTDDPVATLASGRDGVLVSLSRSLNRTSGVYNGCVASGDVISEDIPPVSALVVDNDPTSPTYWYGPFGQVPQFFSSSFLTTPAQCDSAAASLLRTSTGLPYSVDFGLVPNPALDPLDQVLATYPGRAESHVLLQLVIPLVPDAPQTAQSLKQVTGVFQ